MIWLAESVDALGASSNFEHFVDMLWFIANWSIGFGVHQFMASKARGMDHLGPAFVLYVLSN